MKETELEKVPVFSFRRMSGMDQIVLSDDEEWRNLDKLDEKLWMALSCPTTGLEFNADTLALLDTDKDGRIRANDVKAAVAWLCDRLRHPSSLRDEKDEISIESLRDDTESGKALALALKLVLENHSKSAADTASLAEINDVLAEAAGYAFNGDGIVPPDSVAAPEKTDGMGGSGIDMRKFIDAALNIVGAKRDASGKPGLDEGLAAEFQKRLLEAKKWREELSGTKMPLGEATSRAWNLLGHLESKFDDYFCRCRVAAFAPGATAQINEDAILQNIGANIAADGTPLSPTSLNRETLLAMPLSRISEDCVLNLEKGLNPAWSAEVLEFVNLTAPLLKKDTAKGGTLAEQDWETIKASFAEYAAILGKKPQYSLPPDDAEIVTREGFPDLALAPDNDPLKRTFLPLHPNDAISALTDAELSQLSSAAAGTQFSELAAKDLAAPPLASFQDLHKLALFHAHLYTFLMNFLSFIDFYDPDKKAIFQTGTLYLDSRSCLLCVPVDDLDNHARLSAQSHLCLIYCTCTRKNTDGSESSRIIAAALTLGNLASLIEGRHGLFVDDEGLEWDTKITRVVHNPISLREAMWAPYIRISNMVGQQIMKFVADKAAAANSAAAKAVTSVGQAAAAGAPAPKPSFDFAKGAGIFAALSVAVSVLSAAFAYIANSLASLGWLWPLALVGVFVCISGPSMLSAWFKLRRRSLGPLLDASGWAVNKGAPINLVMGASLTALGKLPPNATRNLNDPYSLPGRVKSGKIKAWIFIILLLLIIAACGGFLLYCRLFGEPLWFFTFRAMTGI